MRLEAATGLSSKRTQDLFNAFSAFLREDVSISSAAFDEVVGFDQPVASFGTALAASGRKCFQQAASARE